MFLVHSSTFLFLDGVALLFLNCVVPGFANLMTENMRRIGRIRENSQRGIIVMMATRMVSYLLIHSIALLLVDGLVGGLALVFIDSVANLLRTFLGIIFWEMLSD